MFESISLFNKPKTSRLSGELDQLSKLYLNPLSNQKIKKAVDFADKAHEGQFRKSGEPFLIHPCLLYTSPSPRDGRISRMPSSA